MFVMTITRRYLFKLSNDAFLPVKAIAKAQDANNDITTNISKYACAFVIGGPNPDEPRNRVFSSYDIVVSAQSLKDQGSTTEIITFSQLSVTLTRRPMNCLSRMLCRV